MPFVTRESLEGALASLWGTANHLLKVWLTLKLMGMRDGSPAVQITTVSPTSSLERLFSYGHPDNDYFVPFSHTLRFSTMKHDAARSIIQTTIRRWKDSGSVVTCDPTGYLEITENADDILFVRPGRKYPIGLGHGLNGFALGETARVAVPLGAFAIWFGRQTEIPKDCNAIPFLIEEMKTSLSLSEMESELIFTKDAPQVTLRDSPLDNSELYSIVNSYLKGSSQRNVTIITESFLDYSRRITPMISDIASPKWLRSDPEDNFKVALDSGAKALLLYGPPRTGKTRAIDNCISRSDSSRCTIQIHDGWGYEELMVSLRPDQTSGNWVWHPGELLKALADGKKVVVLEEINRTNITQALGEAFFLLEEAYRGPDNAVKLRDGKDFYIPSDVTFIATMNTLDKSTEQIDDAFIGRVTAIEFPPRAEALTSMLELTGVKNEEVNKLRELFVCILQYYPLGHGYFSGIDASTNIIDYYRIRVRPVLQYHFEGYRDAELKNIDTRVDELWG